MDDENVNAWLNPRTIALVLLWVFGLIAIGVRLSIHYQNSGNAQPANTEQSR